MTTSNVPEDTTPHPPDRALLPRDRDTVGYTDVLLAAIGWTPEIGNAIPERLLDAAQAGAEAITEARRESGRYSAHVVVVEVGALMSVSFTRMMFPAFDASLSTLCPSCGHVADMHGSAGCRVSGGPHGYACGCMEWWKHH